MVSVSDEREDEVFLLIRLQRKKCWVNRTELQLRGDRLGHRAHRGDAGERGKTLSCCRVYISFELVQSLLCVKVMTPVTVQIILCRTSESEDIGSLNVNLVIHFMFYSLMLNFSQGSHAH